MTTDAHILAILKAIDAAKFSPHRRDVWERCWSESGTVPRYFSSGACRQGGRIVDDPSLEYALFCKLRASVFERYFKGMRRVYEFGCGNGQNLVALRDADLIAVGLDWSAAACEHVRSIGFEAYQFDMFAPGDERLDGAVLTVHAMEQLGAGWGPFLDYLVRQRPSVCVHIEPILELYDNMKLLDYLAIQYHKKRGYLSVFLPALTARTDVQILEVTRSHFGNLYHEAYSVVAWRPR